MFPFQPFKDNKPWRRALSIVVGLAFVVWALIAINLGRITITKNNFTFHAANEPVAFWLAVITITALGLAMIYRGIKGKRDPA